MGPLSGPLRGLAIVGSPLPGRDEDDGEVSDSPTAGGGAIVSLTFDDGTADQYFVSQLLAAAGLRATFYVNSNTIGSSAAFLSWEELGELVADGHEIGGHTLDHVDLTAVDASEAARQVGQDREALAAHGLAVTGFAYPFGARSESVESIVRDCGYRSARRSWGLCAAGIPAPSCAEPVAETVPPKDSWAVRSIPSVRTSNTLAELQGVVTRAEDAGGWVPLVFHRVSDEGDGGGYAVGTETLAAFAEWLAGRASQGTRVRV